MEYNNFIEIVRQTQQKISDTRDDLDNTEYFAKSDDNLVKVSLRGEFDITSIDIDKSLLNEAKKETLEKDLKEAINNGIRSIKIDTETTFMELISHFRNMEI